MVNTIMFADVPPTIRNWYDRGTSARRVLRCQVRPVKIRNEIVGNEYIVIHTYGRDFWRNNGWDWKMHRTTDDAAEAHGP